MYILIACEIKHPIKFRKQLNQRCTYWSWRFISMSKRFKEMYRMVTVVSNTVLHIWTFLRVNLKSLIIRKNTCTMNDDGW